MSLSTKTIAEHYATSLRTLSEIANAYYFQGRLDEALHLFQTGEQWLSAKEVRSEDQLSFLLTYGQFLANHYFLTNREADLMRSVVQRARQVAETSQDEAGIATALYLIGETLYYHNCNVLIGDGEDYTEARDYFERSSALHEKIGDPYRRADSLFYTGLTYERHNQEAQAQEYYQQALALAEQHGNTRAASEAMRHLAGLSMARDKEQSLRYALGSLALREEMDFKVALPSAQLLVSYIYLEHGDLAQALEYCQRAEQLAGEMNLQIYQTDALLVRGEVAYKQEQLDKAREHFEQAAVLAHRLNIAYLKAMTHEKLEMLAHEQH